MIGLGLASISGNMAPVRALEFASVNPGAIRARSASQPQSVLTSSWGIASTYWTRGTRPYSRKSISPLCVPLGSKNCQYPRMRNAGGDGTKLLHRRDRAVIEFAMGLMDMKFDTVRGAFWEGPLSIRGRDPQTIAHPNCSAKSRMCARLFHARKLVDGLPSF